MKPRIDRTNLQNIVMKVGHTKLIDVNISGEPVPTVTWSFKDAVRHNSFLFNFFFNDYVINPHSNYYY